MSLHSARKAWSALFGVITLWILILAGDCIRMAVAEHRIARENVVAGVAR